MLTVCRRVGRGGPGPGGVDGVGRGQGPGESRRDLANTHLPFSCRGRMMGAQRNETLMNRPSRLASLFLVVLPGVAVAEGEEAAPVPRVASAEETEACLAELSRRAEGVKSLRVRFRQEKKLRLLRRPRVSTCELVFAGGKLAVTTTGRKGKVESRLLLSDGELKILYPSLSRMEVFPASDDPAKLGGAAAGRRMSMPLFTGDWKGLKKLYTIVMRVTPTDEAGRPLRELQLTPKDTEAPVRRVTLSLVDYRVREYVQEERNGDRVRMQVLEWRRNVDVPPKTFELRVPPKTKIVRVVPEPSS